MKKTLLALVIALILQGCARDAMNPLSLAPATPYSTWTPVQGNRLVSSKYYQTVLPSDFPSSELSLAELIDIALQNNPATKQTWAQARAAAAQYGQSLSPFYPSIAFDGSYLRLKGSSGPPQSGTGTQSTGGTQFSGVGIESTINPGLATQAGPDVTLSYTLFDFGQRSSAATAAREALYFADLNHNQEIQIVIQTVMDDAYEYLYQLALLKSDTANLETTQTSLNAANDRFALGLAALGDVAQARTQYLQSKIILTSQKQNVENAFSQLAVDLGLPAHLQFRVCPLPDQIVANPMLDSIECLITRAQSQRQDFLAAQANVRAKEALLLNAKRAVYPVLSSALDIGHYWFQKGKQENGPHWSAEINLSFPLFQGFFYKNGIKNAQANLEVSQAQMLQTELTIIQNVTTAHMGVKTAAQNLSDSEEYLDAAALEFNIALAGYKAGTMTILDVMSAQSSLADARSKKANSQKNWFSALAAIAYATGSLCANPVEELQCDN